jgi:hypothetical protein
MVSTSRSAESKSGMAMGRESILIALAYNIGKWAILAPSTVFNGVILVRSMLIAIPIMQVKESINSPTSSIKLKPPPTTEELS